MPRRAPTRIARTGWSCCASPSKRSSGTLLHARHRFAVTGALHVLPFRTLDVVKLTERSVARAGETAHRVEELRVDAAVFPHHRIHMRVNDAPEHDMGIAVAHD